MMKKTTVIGFLVVLIVLFSGCSGIQTFPIVARAGDTVAVGLGWQPETTRSNLDIRITDNVGSQYTLSDGDPALRLVFNSYPDPLSPLALGRGGIHTFLLEGAVTGGDNDFSESFVVLDLPSTMSTGNATLEFMVDSSPLLIAPVEVQIIEGVGAPNQFSNHQNLGISNVLLKKLERLPHYTVTFEGGSVPYAIQLDIDNNALANKPEGAVGVPQVVNPTDLKNAMWHYDGTHLRVLLMPASDQQFDNIIDFKFHIVGDIGLQSSDAQVQAFDINGNLLSGFVAKIE